MRKRVDRAGQFFSIFDEKTGFYYRSGIMDQGRDTGKEPFMAEFPELLDVGITGHPRHGVDEGHYIPDRECCQGAQQANRFSMSLKDFYSIAEQSRGKAYQFVLSGVEGFGRHEYFEEVLKICIQNEIVPNIALSGFGITEQTITLCKKYCGAAAVRWSRKPYALQSVNNLLAAGMKTNIHYRLGNSTILEAIDRLERKDFPKGVNAVVFLFDHLVGPGEEKKIRKFCSLIDGKAYPFKIGFDACMVPGLIRYTDGIDFNGIEACSGARWSAYITPDMKMLPCSFCHVNGSWCVGLRSHTIQEAWNSSEFDAFRNLLKSACPRCGDRGICMGGCPIKRESVLCDSVNRQR